MKRILVTGSRTWTNQLTITEALWDGWIDLGRVPTTLVHGACPTGADAIADMVWATNQYPVEQHPAKWTEHGKRAGYVRNALMVALGADLCLAFIKDESKGATMTAELAEQAGIETRRFTA